MVRAHRRAWRSGGTGRRRWGVPGQGVVRGGALKFQHDEVELVRTKWGEKWSGGAGPVEQYAPVSHAQLRRDIPGDGGLTIGYQGKHRMREGVTVLLGKT
jgi:hypothetical protein